MKKKIIFVLTLLISIYAYAQDNSVISKLETGYWIPNFFNDVLQSQNRDTYYKYAPTLENTTREYSDPHFSDYKIVDWYELWKPIRIGFSSRKENVTYGATIQQLVIGNHKYDIKQIKKNKIYITISEENINTNRYADLELNMLFEKLDKLKEFVFIFEFDGDYVDIYINNKKKLFATFCKYDGYTYNELQHLIKGGDFGPWNINYPKRSNGSIDYVSE